MKPCGILQDVIRSLFSKPVTEMYPRAKLDPHAPLRGKLFWDPEQCTGCRLCVMDCPSHAIELITVDKEHGQFEMHYDVSRCIFCAQCVQNCRFGCIQLSSDDWELASDEKGAFVVQYMDISDDE